MTDSLFEQYEFCHFPFEFSNSGELKQAVVAMMLRKEEVEQENRWVSDALRTSHHTTPQLRTTPTGKSCNLRGSTTGPYKIRALSQIFSIVR